MKKKKQFSAETRRKLSEAMKRQWAMRKATNWSELQDAANGTKPSLRTLFSAAVMLSTDNGEELKAAICDCASGEIIVAALEAERSAGTNLQNNIRKQITEFIQNAL